MLNFSSIASSLLDIFVLHKLKIDLIDVKGVFVDPVGIWVVLVDPVLPIDLMDVIGVFVDPWASW